MLKILSKILRYTGKKLYSFFEFIKFLIIPKNKYLAVTLVAVVFVSVFIVGKAVYADFLGDVLDMILSIINVILFHIVRGLGWIAMKVFALLIVISSYNDFVTSPAVNKGWVLIRDVCNMFFVVILLVIAFAQILGVQKYSMKTLLPKVLIAAILVNFSKLICGLIIDMAQVVMMTFVNGYKATAGANLIVGLGLTELLKLGEESGKAADKTVDQSEIMVALLMAFFVVLATIVVTFFILLLLLMRIVTLWILVVLSPAAFLLSSMPFGQGKAGEWWQKFGWTVAVGPFMAFFLWLSLLIMANPEEMMGNVGELNKDIENKGGGPPSQGAYLGNIAQAAIGLAMLMASLVVAQEAGGAMGQLAAKGQAATKGALRKGASALTLGRTEMAVGFGKKTLAHSQAGTQRLQDRGAGAADKVEALKQRGIQKLKQGASIATAPIRSAYRNTVGAAAGKIQNTYSSAKKAVADKFGGRGKHMQEEIDRINGKGANASKGERAKAKFYESILATARQAKTAGGANAVLADSLEQDASGKAIEQATKMLTALGIKDEDHAAILSDSGVDKNIRQAVAGKMAEKGTYQNREQAKAAEKLVASNRELSKAFSAGMYKNQAHLMFDNLDDENSKDYAKFKKLKHEGTIELKTQKADALKDATFLKANMSVDGGKKFTKDAEDVVKRGADFKDAFTDGMKGVMQTVQPLSMPQKDFDALKRKKKIADDNITKIDTKQGLYKHMKPAVLAQRRATQEKVFTDSKKDIDAALKDKKQWGGAMAASTGDYLEAYGARTQNSQTGEWELNKDASTGELTQELDSNLQDIFTGQLGSQHGKKLAKIDLSSGTPMAVHVALNTPVNRLIQLSAEEDDKENLKSIVTELMVQHNNATGQLKTDLENKLKQIASKAKITDALDDTTQTNLSAFKPAKGTGGTP